MESGLQDFGTDACTLSGQVLAVCGSLLVMGVLLLGLHIANGSAAGASLSKEAHAALSVELVPQLIGMLAFTVIILESYSLTKMMGRNAAFSGFLIGLFQLFVPVGNCIMLVCMSLMPCLWKLRPRAILSTCLLGIMFGGLAYAWGSFHVGKSSQAASAALIASRVLSGFSAGVINLLNNTHILHLAPKAERPELTTRLYLANMVGIGGGPAMAAVAASLHLSGKSALPRCSQTGLLQVAAASVGLVAVWTRFPSLSHATSFAEEEAAADDHCTPGHDASLRRARVIGGCLLMTVNRSCVVASLEAASAMLLETKYRWGRPQIGLLVSLTFLLSVPLKLVHGALRQQLSVTAWIRLLACIAFLGSLLFFQMSGGSGSNLLLADAILFPSLYLSDGMSIGVMFQNGFPAGSWFSAKSLILWQSVLGCGVGRFLGPWFARSSVEGGGQDVYATQQLLLCLAFVVTFELAVRPGMASPKVDDYRPVGEDRSTSVPDTVSSDTDAEEKH